jgi:hypothetical protein
MPGRTEKRSARSSPILSHAGNELEVSIPHKPHWVLKEEITDKTARAKTIQLAV